jgi:imidazoleglycerol-phosphate dehydratase
MLNTFAKHGLFDLDLTMEPSGDLSPEALIAQTGGVLGSLFRSALKNRDNSPIIPAGAGQSYFPMEETLTYARVRLDGQGRLEFLGEFTGVPLVMQTPGKKQTGGGEQLFPVRAAPNFWRAFALESGCDLRLEIIRGRGDHHKCEALFKAAARALRQACEGKPL